MVGEPVNGETHNLTCQVSKSLPPPEVKWLVNGIDMTSRAAVSNTTVSPSGKCYLRKSFNC
ncbi:hypothetical protein DPMN_092842 [Dreissena polymorpha]|uniref:Ig-like domain-containing protein n=1 Tax=Dreissena polymorpha TaxID=45954 RepID=A0A9D4L2I8_DREPO|nr:hypothetical protein DPMN_092842 [Dreissena polymorpha]